MAAYQGIILTGPLICRLCHLEPLLPKRRYVFGKNPKLLKELSLIIGYTPLEFESDGKSRYVCEMCSVRLLKIDSMKQDLENNKEQNDKEEVIKYITSKSAKNLAILQENTGPESLLKNDQRCVACCDVLTLKCRRCIFNKAFTCFDQLVYTLGRTPSPEDHDGRQQYVCYNCLNKLLKLSKIDASVGSQRILNAKDEMIKDLREKHFGKTEADKQDTTDSMFNVKLKFPIPIYLNIQKEQNHIPQLEMQTATGVIKKENSENEPPSSFTPSVKSLQTTDENSQPVTAALLESDDHGERFSIEIQISAENIKKENVDDEPLSSFSLCSERNRTEEETGKTINNRQSSSTVLHQNDDSGASPIRNLNKRSGSATDTIELKKLKLEPGCQQVDQKQHSSEQFNFIINDEPLNINDRMSSQRNDEDTNLLKDQSKSQDNNNICNSIMQIIQPNIIEGSSQPSVRMIQPTQDSSQPPVRLIVPNQVTSQPINQAIQPKPSQPAINAVQSISASCLLPYQSHQHKPVALKPKPSQSSSPLLYQAIQHKTVKESLQPKSFQSSSHLGTRAIQPQLNQGSKSLKQLLTPASLITEAKTLFTQMNPQSTSLKIGYHPKTQITQVTQSNLATQSVTQSNLTTQYNLASQPMSPANFATQANLASQPMNQANLTTCTLPVTHVNLVTQTNMDTQVLGQSKLDTHPITETNLATQQMTRGQLANQASVEKIQANTLPPSPIKDLGITWATQVLAQNKTSTPSELACQIQAARLDHQDLQQLQTLLSCQMQSKLPRLVKDQCRRQNVPIAPKPTETVRVIQNPSASNKDELTITSDPIPNIFVSATAPNHDKDTGIPLKSIMTEGIEYHPVGSKLDYSSNTSDFNPAGTALHLDIPPTSNPSTTTTAISQIFIAPKTTNMIPPTTTSTVLPDVHVKKVKKPCDVDQEENAENLFYVSHKAPFRKTRTRYVKSEIWQSFLKEIVRGGEDFGALARKLYEIHEMKREFNKLMLQELNNEFVHLASKKNESSILRKISPENLDNLQFEQITEEIHREAPLLKSIMDISRARSCSAMQLGVTTAMVLHNRCQALSAVHHVIRQILYQGGTKWRSVDFLAKMGITLKLNNASQASRKQDTNSIKQVDSSDKVTDTSYSSNKDISSNNKMTKSSNKGKAKNNKRSITNNKRCGSHNEEYITQGKLSSLHEKMSITNTKDSASKNKEYITQGKLSSPHDKMLSTVHKELKNTNCDTRDTNQTEILADNKTRTVDSDCDPGNTIKHYNHELEKLSEIDDAQFHSGDFNTNISSSKIFYEGILEEVSDIDDENSDHFPSNYNEVEEDDDEVEDDDDEVLLCELNSSHDMDEENSEIDHDLDLDTSELDPP